MCDVAAESYHVQRWFLYVAARLLELLQNDYLFRLKWLFGLDWLFAFYLLYAFY